MALDIETICTDGDLAARAGAKRLNRAQPSVTERDGNRSYALREALLALQGRTPPVYESDLSDPTELRDVVCTRALQITFEQAMTVDDGLFGILAERFAKEHSIASKRAYTVNVGVTSPGGSSIRVGRR